MDEWVRATLIEESFLLREPMALALNHGGVFERKAFDEAYGSQALDREEFGLRFAMTLGACAAKAIGEAGNFDFENENVELSGVLERFAKGAFALREDDFCVAVSVLKNALAETVGEWQCEHGGRMYLSVKVKKRIISILRSCEHYDIEKRVELIDAFSDSDAKSLGFDIGVFSVLEEKGDLARALMIKAEIGTVARPGISVGKSRRI